jgi:hypothetical protein
VTNPIGHVPGPATHLFVSTDHGATWSDVNPQGVTSFSSGLACPGANPIDCVAGGLQGADPVLLVTTDGGENWVGRPLPRGAGSLIHLSCTSLSHCVGVLSTSTNFYSSSGQVYVTVDGGESWNPADTGGVSPQILSCTDTTCVGSGILPGPTPTSAATIVNLYSDDSGSTWKEATAPPGFGFLDGSAESLACPDATHCFGVGGVATTPQQPDEGAVVESNDGGGGGGGGGESWALVSELSGVPAFALACPTDKDCHLVGGGTRDGEPTNSITYGSGGTQVSVGGGKETVPVKISPWIDSTSDGGLTWSRTYVSVPSDVPAGTSLSSLEMIGQISCPSANVCVGLGTGDETAHHTATYTNAPLG